MLARVFGRTVISIKSIECTGKNIKRKQRCQPCLRANSSAQNVAHVNQNPFLYTFETDGFQSGTSILVHSEHGKKYSMSL